MFSCNLVSGIALPIAEDIVAYGRAANELYTFSFDDSKRGKNLKFSKPLTLIASVS
jgi:hypothetical protein